MAMRFRRALGGVALAMALAAAGGAHAAQIYFANILDAPIQVSIDDKPAGSLSARSASWLPLAPGEHVIVVVMQNGSSVSKPYAFDASALATTRNDSWWCMAVAPRKEGSGDGFLLQLPAAECKAFIDAG